MSAADTADAEQNHGHDVEHEEIDLTVDSIENHENNEGGEGSEDAEEKGAEHAETPVLQEAANVDAHESASDEVFSSPRNGSDDEVDEKKEHGNDGDDGHEEQEQEHEHVNHSEGEGDDDDLGDAEIHVAEVTSMTAQRASVQTSPVLEKFPEPIEVRHSSDNDSGIEPPPLPEKSSPDISTSSNTPPSLPPRTEHPPLPSRNSDEQEAPPLPPRKRAPFFWLKLPSRPQIRPAAARHRASGSSVSPDYDLLLSRLEANKQKLRSQNSADRDAALKAISELQHHFIEIKEERKENESIDWSTWTNVVTDYDNFALNHPLELSRAIAAGFPEELRGLIWQLIASSKSSTMEEVYQSIHEESSPHERAIKRDLSRTSFIQEHYMDSLFKIIKAYSLFDPDVGYTQGMAFIAVPLLINMTEAEAFCLLVHLMKDYGMREMFLPEMPGLHIRLYQFDRILEDTLPDVHIHLARQGVRSSMYASQWFLTLFAYKFPLALVLRIFDIVLAEGIEAILRFAVALIKRNAQSILALEFDAVLPFLKERIFDYYALDATPGGSPQYSVDSFVEDAFNIKILPVTLRKYGEEYREIHRIEKERTEEVETLRSQNGNLTLQVRRLESSMATLNQEHIQIANEMVQGKLEIARLQDENENMSSELDELRTANSEGKSLADKELRDEMEEVRSENTVLVETKEQLENQLNVLEKELVETKMKLANLDDNHNKLQGRWNELRKHLEDFK